jgi:hypothetical protein
MVATEREVRIAVVMYGGTSLAIYMNGTSQEFLHLVRATSRAATAGTALRGTARVYRKLAYVLAGKRLSEIDDALLDDEGANPPVRFVIDIVSGTSAGGINSVMLAKALARNTDLAPLKQLWLDEGAIDRLVNDPRSASPPVSVPRTSPLAVQQRPHVRRGVERPRRAQPASVRAGRRWWTTSRSS